jgi:hypothetical protein
MCRLHCTAGDITNSDVKAASLAVYDKIKGNFTDVTNGQPVVLSGGGPEYRAGGGVTLSVGTARDQPGNPADNPQNTLLEVQSFGGTNRWAVTMAIHPSGPLVRLVLWLAS